MRTVHRKLGRLGLDYERDVVFELASENAKDRDYWRQRHDLAVADLDRRGERAVALWHAAEHRARRWRRLAGLGWAAILAGLIWSL